MDEKPAEREKRKDVVLGIFLASAVGFILNLFANLYYDVFIKGDLKWENVNQGQVFSLALILLALIGFLQFFIYDYKNNTELSRSFLKRYWDYFFFKFIPGRIIRFIVGLYILLVLVVFLIMLYFFLASIEGYFITTLTCLVAGLSVYFQERRKQILQ